MVNILVTSTPMMICAILSVLLGLSLSDRWDRPRFRLLLFMIVATLLYAGHYIFFNYISEAIPISDTLYSFANPAVYPLFFIYVEELTQRHPNRMHQLLIMLPPFICCLCVGVLYVLMSEQEMSQFISHHLYGNEYATLTGLAWWQGAAHMMVKIVFALEIPPFLIVGCRHIRRYNQMVRNNYSNTEGKTLETVNSLLILFVVASIASFVCNLIGRYWFASSLKLIIIPIVLFSILILLIGHVGLKQHFYIQDVEEDVETEDANLANVLQPDERLNRELRRLIDEEKLFLHPNLKTSDLAKRLNTNRNYIYNVINVKMGLSFSEFINRKRIDYAIKLIEKNPDRYLSDIANQSGFSSTSAFYRNFKHFQGRSPRDYVEEVLAKK